MDAKCTADEAVKRAWAAIEQGGTYQYGTGDYKPYALPQEDTPFTGDKRGSDCAGFAICWAWKLVRHRPGFNRGSWASVADDINVNSAIEDGAHAQELFTTLRTPELPSLRPGDLLCYPTLYHDGHPFIGHVGLVARVPVGWTPGDGWAPLTVIQCCGPNGRAPAVIVTDGSVWSHHDANSFLDGLFHGAQRVCVVRPHERT